ncbi:MAG: hypothetical protein A2202_09275 [Bdellovibrionales bacterium RIFOXYA1_FULL_36_14]|nr:MAG: hypothetical protein A2202_09275 [Bdellovibrionales bacterium RIFOXYA1_FULL_36_14]
MISKIIRIIGITVIIVFTFSSVFLALVVKEMKEFAKEDSLISKLPATLEDIFYDKRITYTTNPMEKKIVLAEIDDESLSKIGQWPIPRTIWAKIINKLDHFGAKVISFDAIFSEEQPSCKGQVSTDEEFAKAIHKFQQKLGHKVVLSYSTETLPSKFTFVEIPDNLLNYIITVEGEANTYPQYISQSNFPIDILLNANPALGSFSAEPDLDGVFRYYTIVSNVSDFNLPSLSLVTYNAYTNQNVTLIYNENQRDMVFNQHKLNINFMGNTKIRWTGGIDKYQRVNIYNILNASDDDAKLKNIFKDTIVFVGSSATAAHDLRNTAVGTNLPGVYAHMNVVSMLLNGFTFQDKDTSATISWTLIICGSILIILIQLFKNAIIDLIGVTLICTTMFYLDQLYFLPRGYEVKLFFALLAVILIYLWNTFLSFYITSQEKKQIKGTFSRYVSPAIVNEMLSDPSKLKVGGEKREITVFFSDVRDFTSISEQLGAELLSKSLNFYMGEMTDVLFKYYGTVDKYIGDAIVAFWNAPLNVPNHAYQAVKAALEMIEILPEVNKTLTAWNVPEFKHGIGLNTGECSVGNMGSDKIFAYTALGDSMNLGARLESLCKFYGVQLNVSEYTLQSIPADLRSEFSIRTLDKVKVKGKHEAVTIFEVLHSFHPFKKDQDALNKFNQAFNLYLEKKFQEAQAIFKELKEKFPEDKSSTRMYESCSNFYLNPPPADWDGSYVHTTKG